MSRAKYSIPKGPSPQQQNALTLEKNQTLGKRADKVHGDYKSMSHGYLYKGLLVSDVLRTSQILSSCSPVSRPVLISLPQQGLTACESTSPRVHSQCDLAEE